MKKLSELYGFDVPVSGDKYGIELEIEAFDIKKSVPKTWHVKEDGSLRNGGREFVSDPLEFKHIENSLTQLFSCLSLCEDSYSERTSVHVHCNVRDLSTDNIASMALLYLVVEGIFFSYVDKSRSKNIFCVSLNQFQAAEALSNCFYKPDMGNGMHWEKYSAFNLLPLSQFGTIEFRHMQGTSDVPYIVAWIEAINQLKTQAQKHTFDEWFAQISVLNNTSEYYSFARRLFGDCADKMFRGLSYSDYKNLMYPGIVQAKLWQVLNQQKVDAEIKAKAKVKKIQNILLWDDTVLMQAQGQPATPATETMAQMPRARNVRIRMDPPAPVQWAGDNLFVAAARQMAEPARAAPPTDDVMDDLAPNFFNDDPLEQPRT